jgi:hypothetical protein
MVAPLYPLRYFIAGHRLSVQVPLDLVAAHIAQQPVLVFGFHAFGDYIQTQAVGQADDGTGNGLVLPVGAKLAHK